MREYKVIQEDIINYYDCEEIRQLIELSDSDIDIVLDMEIGEKRYFFDDCGLNIELQIERLRDS